MGYAGTWGPDHRSIFILGIWTNTVRHSSGPKGLTNKIVKVGEQNKCPHLTTSSNTHSNDITWKPSCFTESLPKDPKDAQKVFPGFKRWISVSHVPLLPQQQSCIVFLKETCILCSDDQVLFTRTHFTTNLKTVTITLFWLLHKGRLQPKVFINVWGTAVTFPSQVLRVLTEENTVLLQHFYCS